MLWGQAQEGSQGKEREKESSADTRRPYTLRRNLSEVVGATLKGKTGDTRDHEARVAGPKTLGRGTRGMPS